jgi:hypothetical protein
LADNYPNTLINQFPFEAILTVKDLFADTVRRVYETIDDGELTMPSWLQTTFNLSTELPDFVAYYQNCAKRYISIVG